MGWTTADALWYYTPLSEPTLSSELERLSFAQTIKDTDVVSFQPCPDPEQYSQDRYIIQDWALPNGIWTFRAIFDGHAGHDTVDYTKDRLPDIVQKELLKMLGKGDGYTPADVSDALTRAISEFDKSIGEALLKLFPDADALAKLSDEEIHRVISSQRVNQDIILHCERGTTVLISLVSPVKSDIWVASLGDCAAVLGTTDSAGEWSATVLSSAHNGENEVEANRIRSEHPGEPECMLDNRVLGAIAVTRAVGDFSFKLPAVYTERVLFNARPDSVMPDKVRKYIGRNLTPPYMTGVPDVKHLNLSALGSEKTVMVMCSDGLVDLSDDRLKLHEVLSKAWVKLVGEHYGDGQNLALRLLRDALGGEDSEKVSRMITVEMGFRWMDDTTILVQRL
ncbi:protein serine/threonine phosphatase 2C [Agrocybe pediades]|nr:protein serine/threonine phosphatase 2C [Agrocybe pediades]